MVVIFIVYIFVHAIVKYRLSREVRSTHSFLFKRRVVFTYLVAVYIFIYIYIRPLCISAVNMLCIYALSIYLCMYTLSVYACMCVYTCSICVYACTICVCLTVCMYACIICLMCVYVSMHVLVIMPPSKPRVGWGTSRSAPQPSPSHYLHAHTHNPSDIHAYTPTLPHTQPVLYTPTLPHTQPFLYTRARAHTHMHPTFL